MRVGQGFDVHRLVVGRDLILGGVNIPHTHGLEAHSDGDVLIHALCDALLGAAGLGDIGKHFPDTDESFSGADSQVLLRSVVEKLKQAGMQLCNADCTIIAQSPKMAPYIQQMKENLAEDCEVDPALVSIKATTTEQLGFTGRKEGIAAQAVVLLNV